MNEKKLNHDSKQGKKNDGQCQATDTTYAK